MRMILFNFINDQKKKEKENHDCAQCTCSNEKGQMIVKTLYSNWIPVMILTNIT